MTLGCDYVAIPYNHVIHCEPARSEMEAFVEMNTIPVTNAPPLDFYFAAPEAQMGLTSEVIAHNIASALTQQVNFPALVQRAYRGGARILWSWGRVLPAHGGLKIFWLTNRIVLWRLIALVKMIIPC